MHFAWDQHGFGKGVRDCFHWMGAEFLFGFRFARVRVSAGRTIPRGRGLDGRDCINFPLDYVTAAPGRFGTGDWHTRLGWIIAQLCFFILSIIIAGVFVRGCGWTCFLTGTHRAQG